MKKQKSNYYIFEYDNPFAGKRMYYVTYRPLNLAVKVRFDKAEAERELERLVSEERGAA